MIDIACDRPEDTEAVARSLAGELRGNDVIGLVGDLGAGKTLFVQALARALAVPKSVRVTSPTFTLINEYPGGRLPLVHADLYRLGDVSELTEIGLDDALGRGAVVAIEWSDRFDVLPADHLLIEFSITGATTRVLRVTGSGPRGAALEAALSG